MLHTMRLFFALCLVPIVLFFTPFEVAFAQSEGPLPRVATPQSMKIWRNYLQRVAAPSLGCFRASYPSTRWTRTPCRRGPNRPHTVGDGAGDFTATPSVGRIQIAEGFFRSVTGVTSANDSQAVFQDFSVQLNTNRFKTQACLVGSLKGCVGWQQFVFDEDLGQLFVEYWLLNFGPSCPSGWLSGGDAVPNSCWRNSDSQLMDVPFAVTALVFDWADVTKYSMTAVATSAFDTLIWIDGQHGNAYAIANPDDVLGLSSGLVDIGASAGWVNAEFNILGLGNGSQLNFNAGSTLVLGLSLDSQGGTFSPPICLKGSTTAETNNLSLADVQFNPTIEPWPSIEFSETNVSPLNPPFCGTRGGDGLGANAVYRWFLSSQGGHFYTQDPSGELAINDGYQFEGPRFALFELGAPGTTAFTRWLTPSGHHFYTTSATGEACTNPQGVQICQSEGVLGYIATSQIPGTVPLYRWYRPDKDDHFYTIDPAGELAPAAGYHCELVAGYVKPVGASPPPSANHC